MSEADGLDLVRLVFPDADDEEALCLLWNATGFPEFWNIPADGNTPAECALKQLCACRQNESAREEAKR